MSHQGHVNKDMTEYFSQYNDIEKVLVMNAFQKALS